VAAGRSPSSRLLGFVFDLDETLAPDTTTQYLRLCGVDVAEFWSVVQARMRAGWDQVPAYMYGIFDLARQPNSPITAADMAARGSAFVLFPGVEDLVPRLRAHVRALGWAAEFYLLSSGLLPVVQALPVASHFDGLWTSDFECDTEGRPLFPRQVISFTDKTRPLIEISKGITREMAAAKPFLVNARVAGGAFRIPFHRMVFVGDGLTDVPCFAMITKARGSALAVYDEARDGARAAAGEFLADGRVAAIAKADYRADGEAYLAICRATARIIEAEAGASVHRGVGVSRRRGSSPEL
jgi:phosphoserine phosphatase